MEDNTNSGNPVQGTEFSVEGFSVLQAGQLFFFTNTNSGNPVSGPEVRGRAGGGGPQAEDILEDRLPGGHLQEGQRPPEDPQPTSAPGGAEGGGGEFGG